MSKLKKRTNDLKHANILAKYHAFRNLIEDLTPFQQRFFDSQLRNKNRKPKGRTFTFEDKADAIAIYKSSPKTYRLLSRMFVLPSE